MLMKWRWRRRELPSCLWRITQSQTWLVSWTMDAFVILTTITSHTISVIHAGPGTSLRRPPGTASRGISQGIRPLSQSGRPLSGFVRPGTQSSRPKTMEQAIMTPRTAMTAR